MRLLLTILLLTSTACTTQEQYPVEVSPNVRSVVRDHPTEHRIANPMERNRQLYEQARKDADRRTWIQALPLWATAIVMAALVF